MSDDAETARQTAVMVAGVRTLATTCEAAGIAGPTLAEHMFDAGRTALAHFGGKRTMAECCRKLALAYDEAADHEESKSRH